MVELVRRTGADLLGQDNILSAAAQTAADHFVYRSISGWASATRSSAINPLHHPRFRVDEQALSIKRCCPLQRCPKVFIA
ncbi:hypothetical protein [Mesorhizobium sp. WSM3882]|uniref:hypothetical protein n=1 Tax=Mesorhizobium sp. WSM3882 TaxID=2029407 RepID=UPI001FDA5ED4|nr:hypothetical protein [Mesorhizobium sp. WSM3882]